MIHYILNDSKGNFVQRGHCSTEDDIPVVPGFTSEVVSEDDPRYPVPAVQDSYQDHRRFAYPNIGDQLDAIWRLLNQSGLLATDPAAKALFDQVNSVKVKYPKK